MAADASADFRCHDYTLILIGQIRTNEKDGLAPFERRLKPTEKPRWARPSSTPASRRAIKTRPAGRAAKKLGVKSDDIYVEKASGSRHDRPVLAKATAACEKGDTLACWKLDRVGRSVAHLSKLLADLEARGVHFRTIEDGLDTRGSTGKLVLHMLGAVAQFERDLIIERTKAGLAIARKNGKRLGPPIKWQPDMAKQARKLMKSWRAHLSGGRQRSESFSPDAVPRLEGGARA